MTAARALAPTAKAFAAWCDKNGMAEGRFNDQQERAGAMIIAHLVDEGVVPHGLDEDDVPREEWLKLDLANCMRTAPTNILKWARKDQPELFPHVARKRHEEKKRQALRKRVEDGERTREEIADDDLADLYQGHSAACRAFATTLAGSNGDEAAFVFLRSLYAEGGLAVLQVLADAIEILVLEDAERGEDE